MAFSKRKQALIDEARELGFSEEDIIFLSKKNIRWIETEIDSEKTFRIVAQGCQKSRLTRRN